MSKHSFFSKLLKSRESLPSLEDGEAAARASDMPWLSHTARHDFEEHPEVQGGFGDERATLAMRQGQRLRVKA